MVHEVTVNVSKNANNGIIACKVIPIKNRYLRKILGDIDKATLIIPGDSVRNITIKEITQEDEGGLKNE